MQNRCPQIDISGSRLFISATWKNQMIRTSLSKTHVLPCGTSVKLLDTGERYFSELLKDIKASTKEVLLEKYWFADDLTGRNIKTALTEASGRDVSVKLIFDSFGSFYSKKLFSELTDSGASVQEFNPVSCRKLFSGLIWRRNHRKIAVIDNNIAYVGGMNFGNEWISKENGGSGWRDLMFKLEGPIAITYSKIFNRMSALLNHSSHDFFLQTRLKQWSKFKLMKDPLGENRLRAHPQLQKFYLSQNLWRLQKKKNHTSVNNVNQDSSKASCIQILTNDGFSKRKSITRAYVTAIKSAKQSIYLCHAYFLPSSGIITALIKALKRGVKVTLIVPLSSDVKIYDFCTATMSQLLMKHGAEIYNFSSSMLHSKVATFDEQVSLVGSFNLDPISIKNNLEILTVIHDPVFSEDLTNILRTDITSNCVRKTDAEFKIMPYFTNPFLSFLNLLSVPNLKF